MPQKKGAGPHNAPQAGAGEAPGIAVVVIEDDSMVRAWLRATLEESGFRIAGEASSTVEGFELLSRRRADVLVVDYRLGDHKGTEFVRELRQRGFAAPAVLITASPERGLNELAREAGVQATVVKTGNRDELLMALRGVLRGETAFDPRHPKRAPGRAALSPREREVVHLVAGGATNRDVAEALGVREETVKTLLTRTFSKLGVRRRAEAVAVAQKLGLL
jgi:DNA-binding NarL/FixJ family response regulator